MRCGKARKNLTAYIDGELDGRALEPLKAHLDDCPECRAVAAELKTTSGILSGLTELEPSPGFDATFWARIKEEKIRKAAQEAEREERRRAWLGVLGVPALRPALAAAVVVLVAVGLIYHRAGRDERLARNGVEPSFQEIQMALEIDMLREMEMLQNLDLLEDFEAIAQLDLYAG